MEVKSQCRISRILSLILVSVSTLLLSSAQVQQPQIILVDGINGDDDSGSGTPTHPLQTITRALQIAPDGSTIQVEPGIYDAENGETFPIQVPDNVTLIATQVGSTVLAGLGTVSAGAFGRFAAVLVAGDSEIHGFKIVIPNKESTLAVYPPTGILAFRSTTRLVINENEITSDDESAPSRGIHLEGASATITNNHIFKNGLDGIFTRIRPEQLILSGNTVEENGKASTDMIKGDGIHVIGISIEITGNKITDNASAGIRVGSNGALIADNVIQFNGEVGLYAYHPTNSIITVSNNLWNPDLQGSNSLGRYSPIVISGPDNNIASSPQKTLNFAIQNQNSILQFE